jgi:acetyl-CoA synthetase
MRETLIRKDTQTNRRSDIEALRADFSWARAEERLAGLPGGLGLNIAYEAVDRHVDAGRGTETALRWVARDRSVRTFTYEDLSTLSNRFANALIGLGVERGATVFSFLGRVPELFVTALGTWKRGAVFCPLFSAFGPEPIKSRMTIASACVLVTTQRLYQRKVVPILADLPFLKHIILIDGGDGGLAFDSLLRSAGDSFIYIDTQADELSTLHFTSGTTGKPKAAMHVHGAVVAHVATARMALDLGPSDVYWCTADPGWVTGTSYGIIAPLAVGATAIVDQEEFDAERWYSILADERINVWYTAPTAIRMLMRAGEQLPQSFDLSALRFIASVGEPLNPEAVLWGDRVLGRPIHDNWWQSETGGIMIANVASMDIKPGSMGKPLPGIEAAIVQRLDGKVDIIDTPDTDGELALKRGWPSMFRGYHGYSEFHDRIEQGDRARHPGGRLSAA